MRGPLHVAAVVAVAVCALCALHARAAVYEEREEGFQSSVGAGDWFHPHYHGYVVYGYGAFRCAVHDPPQACYFFIERSPECAAEPTPTISLTFRRHAPPGQPATGGGVLVLEVIPEQVSEHLWRVVYAQPPATGSAELRIEWPDGVLAEGRVMRVNVHEPVRDHAAVVPVVWYGSLLHLGGFGHLTLESLRRLLADPYMRVSSYHVRADWLELSRPDLGNYLKLYDNMVFSMEAVFLRAPDDVTGGGKFQITIQPEFPPRRVVMDGAYNIVWLAWECSTLPFEMTRMMPNVHEIWAPSTFTRDAILRSYEALGLHGIRVVHVPDGVDPERFHPGTVPLPMFTAPPAARTRFVFNSGLTNRKGVDVLLGAYLDEFTSADPVCLLIKTHYKTIEMSEELLTPEYLVKRAGGDPERMPCLLTYTKRTSEAELPRLYSGATAYVLPYRAEGFGLTVLEAMASEVPVVVTAGGATDDFVDETVGYRIPSVARPCSDPCFNNGTATDLHLDDADTGERILFHFPEPCMWREPDAAALRRILRHVHDNPDEARAKGVAARQRVLQSHTWDHSIARARARIRQIDQEQKMRDTRVRLYDVAHTAQPASAANANLPAGTQLM